MERDKIFVNQIPDRQLIYRIYKKFYNSITKILIKTLQSIFNNDIIKISYHSRIIHYIQFLVIYVLLLMLVIHSFNRFLSYIIMQVNYDHLYFTDD